MSSSLAVQATKELPKHVKKQFQVGVVVSAGGKMNKTVKVRLPKREFNTRIKKMFHLHRHVFAADLNNSINEGDVVRIRNAAPIRFSKNVPYIVDSIVSPFGTPVSARPPLGTVEQKEVYGILRKAEKALRIIALRVLAYEQEELRREQDRFGPAKSLSEDGLSGEQIRSADVEITEETQTEDNTMDAAQSSSAPQSVEQDQTSEELPTTQLEEGNDVEEAPITPQRRTKKQTKRPVNESQTEDAPEIISREELIARAGTTVNMKLIVDRLAQAPDGHLPTNTNIMMVSRPKLRKALYAVLENVGNPKFGATPEQMWRLRNMRDLLARIKSGGEPSLNRQARKLYRRIQWHIQQVPVATMTQRVEEAEDDIVASTVQFAEMVKQIFRGMPRQKRQELITEARQRRAGQGMPMEEISTEAPAASGVVEETTAAFTAPEPEQPLKKSASKETTKASAAAERIIGDQIIASDGIQRVNKIARMVRRNDGQMNWALNEMVRILEDSEMDDEHKSLERARQAVDDYLSET